VDDNRRPDEIRRAAGSDDPRADRGADTTQTFGHDSDLSFIPFGADLSTAELDAIEALPAHVAILIVRSGPTAGARYLLDTDVTTVGRHPEADIFFDDVTVSRRHAEITRDETGFEIVTSARSTARTSTESASTAPVSRTAPRCASASSV